MRFFGTGAVSALIALRFVAPASADDCSSFNLLGLHPNELERCIEQLQMDQQLADQEIATLNIQLCTVALKLDHIEPGDDLASVYCPKRAAAKKKPGKPSKPTQN